VGRVVVKVKHKHMLVNAHQHTRTPEVALLVASVERLRTRKVIRSGSGVRELI
jgi:hypothetical protein